MNANATPPRYFALIPCAGNGSRAGTTGPKQYERVAGQPMVWHTLSAFAGVKRIARTLVVVAPGDGFFERNPTFGQRFQITRITYRQSEEWEAWPRLLRKLIPYDWARTHLFNVCKEMRVEAVRRP